MFCIVYGVRVICVLCVVCFVFVVCVVLCVVCFCKLCVLFVLYVLCLFVVLLPLMLRSIFCQEAVLIYRVTWTTFLCIIFEPLFYEGQFSSLSIYSDFVCCLLQLEWISVKGFQLDEIGAA